VPILWPVRRNPCQRSARFDARAPPLSAPQGQHLRVGLAWRADPTRRRAQRPPGRRPPRQENSRWRENAKSGRARKHFLRAQCIASIGETGEDVVVRNTWIILQNIGFAPSVGHQADHEFDGNSRAAYDGFAREHVRRKHDARMIHDGWLSDPVFRIDITRIWRGARRRTGPTAPPGECTRAPGLGPGTLIYSILTTAMLRGRYQGRGTAPVLLERRQSGERAHPYGHVHRQHRAAPRQGRRTAGQGSGRDCAGGIHHAKQWRLDHVRQIPELTGSDSLWSLGRKPDFLGYGDQSHRIWQSNGSAAHAARSWNRRVGPTALPDRPSQTSASPGCFLQRNNSQTPQFLYKYEDRYPMVGILAGRSFHDQCCHLFHLF